MPHSRQAKTDASTLIAEVRRLLAPFRKSHGWEEGKEWNPATATYEWPEGKRPKK